MDSGQNKRAFLYIRVSTLEQAKGGYSIEFQEESLRAYAKAKGYTIVKVYSDPGYSGATIARPAMHEMIHQLELGAADIVLVHKLDRLSRSQKDTLFLIEEIFLKNGIDFVSINESFDTSTPFGRAMIGILSVFAQLEREQIKERSMQGREARAKNGLWHGGGGGARIITGYDYVDGLLQVNDYEASCVKFIYQEYFKGHGLAKILDEVTDKFPGVITSETSVRDILDNPVYTGKIKFKGELHEGIHEPLVTQDMYDKAQELRRKRTSVSQPFRKSYLLSGVIYCGLCGARMRGRTGGKLKDGVNMRYYSCYSRTGPKRMKKTVTCDKTHDKKEVLEEKVISQIKELTLRNFQQVSPDTKQVDQQIKVIEDKIKTIDNQVSNLVDLYSIEESPLEVVSAKIAQLKQDKVKLRAHLKDLEVSQEDKNIDEIKEIVSQLSSFDWDREETDQKRLLVAKLINKITVSNDNLTIEWAF